VAGTFPKVRPAPKRAAFEEPGAAAPGSARGEPQAPKGRPRWAISLPLSALGIGWHLSGGGVDAIAYETGKK